ncbi:MAG: SPOR domain-containing protein [Bacteroidales bacterium]|nr:SPOR domain-containing protein [Bacteroidales bacterium]
MHHKAKRSLCCLMVFMLGTFSGVMGQVSLFPDEKVSALVERQQALLPAFSGKSMGYRVQLFFSSGSNSREQANRVRNEFVSKYPKMSVYVVFKEPNFQVLAGDFRTRAEAVGFLREIEGLFPQSFVVKDEIAYVKHEIKKE